MIDINKLIQKLSQEEQKLLNSQFLAPCVKGGQVQTKIDGLIYSFAATPKDFEGWGIFAPQDEKNAKLIEEASFVKTMEYLKLFPLIRLRLAHALIHQTWIAYPINEGSCKKYLQKASPVLVHLVQAVSAFEQIIARFDGKTLWFEEVDRSSDPQVAEKMRQALDEVTLPKELKWSGITPEMRTTYEITYKQMQEFMEHFKHKRDKKRLQKALKVGGGNLRHFQDRGDSWLVEWTTNNGERHTSRICKSDLTVVSAGICLDERDRDFDLQSLVGVVEKAEDW